VPADGTRAAIGGSGDVFGKLTDKAILACVYQDGGAGGKEQGGEQLFAGLSVQPPHGE
jgi:hypothetical protein